MAVFAVVVVLLFTMAVRSDASYCICNSNVGESLLQKNIDYACGTGAQCNDIHQNGPCFTPNTVKDHCNFAVNSYYQSKGQVNGSCDFQGTATVTQSPPSVPSGCVFQSSTSSSSSTSTVGLGPTADSTTLLPGNIIFITCFPLSLLVSVPKIV